MSGGQLQPPPLPIDVGQLLIEIEQLRQRVRELETENKHIQRDLGEIIQQLNNAHQEHINFKNSRRDEFLRQVDIVSRKLFGG